MSISYPTALDALSNPVAGDALTGHAAQHADTNDAIEALQAKVGITGSEDPASLDYKIATHVGSGGTAHTNAVAAGAAGFMTGADKSKLDGVEAAANNYAHPANHAPSIITQDALNRFVTDAEKATWNAKQAALGFTPIDAASIGQASGVAPLDAGSKIAAAYLPSYVDDILEFASLAAFPATGESGKQYVTLDTNLTYRWSGSVYVEISASPGSTDAVAEGAANLYHTAQRVRDTVLSALSVATNAAITAADSVLSAFGKLQAQITAHLTNTSNPHSVTKAQVGLNNVDDTSDANKPVSTAQQTALDLKQATSAKDASGGYAGLTLFKINFKNALNTFTSFFTNANTAARTYTFQDRDGTIADNTDLALKAPLASPSFTGTLTHSGDIVLSGSGKRITGDFSNATIADRLMFQTSVVNGSSSVAVIPNGTGALANLRVYNSADTENASFGVFGVNTTDIRIQAFFTGTGASFPLAFYTNNVERLTIGTSGDVLVTNAGGLGYGTGAGGTVTQATSRTTAVSLNKPTGDITLFTAAGSATPASFTVNNSLVSIGDVPTIAVRSATNKYVTAITNVAVGSFEVTFWTTGGTASDTPIFHFNLGKGATS